MCLNLYYYLFITVWSFFICSDNTNIIIVVTDLSITGLKDTHRYLNLFKNHRTTDQQIILVVNKHGEYRDGRIEIEDFEKALNHKINLFLPFDGKHPWGRSRRADDAELRKGSQALSANGTGEARKASSVNI